MTAPHSPADPAWNALFLAWLLASAATLAALFLGEVLGHTPCVLCWYQRICMFPLVLVLGAGLLPSLDARVVRYALPLTVAGLLLALYHWALASGWLPENAAPCQKGVPCSQNTVVWFGFVTLPLLSVLAFSGIMACLLYIRHKVRP